MSRLSLSQIPAGLTGLMTVLAATLFHANSAAAEFMSFSRVTDTIAIARGTELGTSATIEAVVSLNVGSTAFGTIYFEQVAAKEHKQLSVWETQLNGYAFVVGADQTPFNVATTVEAGRFHHVAFVRDGTEERFYLDGQRVGVRAFSGDIGDSPNGEYAPSIGAGRFDINDAAIPSFLGLIDSFRISDVARYVGASFVPTVGDLSNDPGTLLLYNFNANEVIGNRILDQSGNGRDGTLGAGFVGATTPFMVPEPGGLASAAIGLAVLGLFAGRRRSRSSVVARPER